MVLAKDDIDSHSQKGLICGTGLANARTMPKIPDFVVDILECSSVFLDVLLCSWTRNLVWTLHEKKLRNYPHTREKMARKLPSFAD